MIDPSHKILANLVMNNLRAELKKRKLSFNESPIGPELMGFFSRGIAKGLLTNKQVKERIVSIMEDYDTLLFERT